MITEMSQCKKRSMTDSTVSRKEGAGILQAGDCIPWKRKVREMEVSRHACPYSSRGSHLASPGQVGIGASHRFQHSAV